MRQLPQLNVCRDGCNRIKNMQSLNHRNQRTSNKAWWTLAAGALLCVVGVVGSISTAHAEPPKPKAEAAADEGPDMLIFRDGSMRKGTVISETATTVKFKGLVAGLPYETEFSMADILKVSRGVAKPADAKTDAKVDGKADPKIGNPSDSKLPPAAPSAADGHTKYYWITLEGEFGEQISQTPLRDSIKDARLNGADTIIIEFHPDWKIAERFMLPEAAANFDEVFRAEKLAEIFTDDIPMDWSKRPPRVVFWVRNAMGGAALLPMVCKELYFHSEARMGGLGNLSTIFKGVGDDVVGAKQRSLRLGHAEGWAIAGGYDSRLVRAMARFEYVLSYRMKDGKPELFEGYPTNPGEELLTDDGKEGNQDGLEALVRGEGNDVLTVTARQAEILGLSRKTVDSKDDLLAAMDIALNAQLIPGASKRIMRDWTNGIDSSKRQLKKLVDDLGDVRVNGTDKAARSRARGQRKSILEDIRGILKGKFGEGITARWLNENRIPGEAQINIELERIKIEQMKDK